MTVLTFNGNAQQFVLTDVTFAFEGSGIISVNSNIKMFRRWPYETGLDYFRLGLEIVFALLIFYQIYGELREMAQAVKEAKSCCKGLCLYWSDVNNVVDWISMALFIWAILVWMGIVTLNYYFVPKSIIPVYIPSPAGYDCKSARCASHNTSTIPFFNNDSDGGQLCTLV